MNTNELMIGDWCAYGIGGKGTVTTLSKYMVTLAVDGDETNGLYQLMPNMVEPIQLTLEILDKNFGEDNIDYDHEMREHFHVIGHWGIAGNNPPFAFCHRNDWAAIKTIPINYIHELQNLLRIVGIEKEIEL